jgi:hypothetical protein
MTLSAKRILVMGGTSGIALRNGIYLDWADRNKRDRFKPADTAEVLLDSQNLRRAVMGFFW